MCRYMPRVTAGVVHCGDASCRVLLPQMASALAHIHARNVVHIDIKPDNIYTSQAGLFKLGDFGLATLKHGHYRVQEGDSRWGPPGAGCCCEMNCSAVMCL